MIPGIVAARRRNAAVDPYWANVRLYLDWYTGSSNGNSLIVDQSSAPHTMTAVGNATVSNVDGAYGTTLCGVFDGTGDNWRTPDSADWEFGSATFTIEGTAYTTVNNELNFIVSHRNTTGSNAGWFLYMDGAGKLTFVAANASNTFSIVADAALSINTQFDWAISRVGDTCYMIINGSTVKSGAMGAGFTIGNGDGLLWVGSSSNEDGTRDWKGRMYRMRITQGVGRYSAAYTPAFWPKG